MPIISISRGSHSGGAQLAQRLHERLGWRVVSQEILGEAANLYGVSVEEVSRGLDMPANFFERITHRKQRYILACQATLGELFPDGNGIYHGLAGQFLFQGLCNVFKVRLRAPMDFRIEQTMEAHGMTREEAVRHIDEIDVRRAKWGRQMFGIDWNDPDLYDLVVNLEQMNVDGAADLIAEALERGDYKPTPRCVEEFRNFTLERRVRAELFFNSSYNPDVVNIRVDGGRVILGGGTAFEQSRTGIVSFVSNLPGVDEVRVESGADVTFTGRDLGTGISSRDTTAADVMMPADRYPRVPEWASIRDTIVALGASAVLLEDGYLLPPRYVLVEDGDGRLVGVVSRRELLKGLVPQLRKAERSRAAIRQIAGFGGDMPSEISIQWNSLFSHAAVTAASEPVRTVMAPVKGTVRVTDSLSAVVTTMIHHGVDLIPVLEGDKVVGVVLMTNIFDIVAQFIIEHGGSAGS
jgi:cytidylate kinase/CBS domain-containing protein